MTTKDETRLLVTGNTYPVREQLRALGGKWDPASKGWWVPVERSKEARALVEPKLPAAKTTRPGLRPEGPGGICRACGDDCGGTNWRCGYE